MQFENDFEVPLPPDDAWKVLLDVPRIAPCFPGAELTETLEDNRYKGRAGVKVGPVNLFFAGEAQIVEKDDEAKTARVKARGNDTKGRGQASATVDFSLVPEGDGSKVLVKTDLNLTGAVAQYGRASGLMKEIAGALIGQFADNLRKEIEASKAPASGERADAATAGPHTQTAPTGREQKAAVPVSAFGLLWTALKSWLAKLFGASKESNRS